MATSPIASSSSSTQGFKPAFSRVQQTDDFSCAFAVVAMLAGTTIEDVKQVAVSKFGHPKHGPYWITEGLIQKLLTHYQWVATFYKESTGIASLPDIAIGMVDYDAETELGRHVLFHRFTPEGAKQPVEYILDPAYWVTEPAKQVRLDIKGMPIAWYIGCHRAATVSKGSAK
jgi:hypothetical protein